MIEQRIEKSIADAIERCRQEGVLSFQGDVTIEVGPSPPSFGDFATNIALILAARAGRKPRAVAEAIASRIEKGTILTTVEVAGPGFINFRVRPQFYLEGLSEIFEAGSTFGQLSVGKGKRLQIEFVSANPTGPLHIGHGRGAVYGDVLASIFSELGFDVTKEYYVNDAGGQIKTLGRSVYLRLRELGGEQTQFPPECYQGHYIIDIAREMRSVHASKIAAMGEEEAIEFCGNYASGKIFDDIKRDLAETGVIHDTYFFETRLYTDAAVEGAITKLSERGHIYEKDGAIWFRSSIFGDDKDRVLKKSDGGLTYFAGDIAYHKNKYERGFDRVIDIWGADHAGYVGRMKAAVAALGHDPKSFDAVLIQLVNLVRGGEVISMSTRTATYETLEDVRREVGRDVCRYFFLMRSHNAQLDFDLDLAKNESPDNPVYYIQYAHARISSIFRKAQERGLEMAKPDSVNLDLLDLPEEPRIARMLHEYPKVIATSAAELEPHRLAFYLLELARLFQSYYSRGRKDERYKVVSDDIPRSRAKLYLLKNVQIVLQNTLRILGISAPSEMAREGDND